MEKNHGKLSGLSVVDIKNGVEELWRKEVGAAAGGVGAVGFRRVRPSGGQLAGAGEEEVTDCSICLEKMGGADYMELNPCKHRFHRHCIRVSLGAGRNVILSLIDFISRPGSTPREVPGTLAPTAGIILWM